MLKIAIVGAGAVGSATAAYLTQRGYTVGLSSPTFSKHAAEEAGYLPITTTGALEGRFLIAKLSSFAQISEYDIVIITLPATAYSDVLPKLAPYLTSRQNIIFSGSLSLAPLWLRELSQSHGEEPTVIAWGTTLMAAHFQKSGQLHIPFIRKQFDVAAIPASKTEESIQLCAEIFNIKFGAANSVLDVCLSNINPTAHAGQIVINFSRIDAHEDWLLFKHFTQGGINIAEALDTERLEIAAAFGAAPRSLQLHFALSYDVKDASIPEMVKEIEQKGSRTHGPNQIEHRHLSEDMPYGLVFLEKLGTYSNVNTPITTATISLLEIMTGRKIRENNKIIDKIFLKGDDAQSILSRCIA